MVTRWKKVNYFFVKHNEKVKVLIYEWKRCLYFLIIPLKFLDFSSDFPKYQYAFILFYAIYFYDKKP